MRGACRRHAWLRACLCDAHALHTPTSSVVSKNDTRGGGLSRHPSLTAAAAAGGGAAVASNAVTAAAVAPNSVGTTTTHSSCTITTAATTSSSSNNNNNIHSYNNTINTNGFSSSLLGSSNTNIRVGGTMATDTIVTTAATTPLHHAHMANVVAAHHINNNDHHYLHHQQAPKHSQSSSSYSDQILLERSNNFSVPTSPSLSSSPTSSSASELNASFGVPHPDNGHSSSYQNYLAFRVQQLNAAQIYASPPGTPLSQLYDTAGPSVSAQANGEPSILPGDPRYNPHNIYQACHPTTSPHIYLQPQVYPRSEIYTRELNDSSNPPQNSLALASPIPSMSSGNTPRSISSSVLQNYHNPNQHSIPHRLPNSHSIGGSSQENDSYLQSAHEVRSNNIRSLQTIPYAGNSGVTYRAQPKSQFQYTDANHLVQLVKKSSRGDTVPTNEISQHVPNNFKRTAAS